jgi:hypothetical protein
MAQTVQDSNSDSKKIRENRDIAWGSVWLGYGLALVGTSVAGSMGLFLWGKGMWWVASVGTIGLLLGGAIAGIAARSAEPLNGAWVAVFYFGTAVSVTFGGEFLGLWPDPLPGLPRGDSTFFFVWPLGQLVAATIGSVLGGWLVQRHRRRNT